MVHGHGPHAASFTEANFLKHLLGGIEIAAGASRRGLRHGRQPRADGDRAAQPARRRHPGDPVAFTATGADPDGDTLTYAWDFGDGGTATTKDAMHTYNAVGVFYAKVTVSDGKGGKDSALLQVVVQPMSDNEEEVGVGGVVPGVLSLNITGSANFGAFVPGVTRDYPANLAATATSSATAAELTVRDPSSQATRPSGQRHARAGAGRCRSGRRMRPTRARRSRRCPRPRPAAPAGVPDAAERPSADDRLQAVDRGDRVAGHRRLRQDAGVHALGDHAVEYDAAGRPRFCGRPAGRLRG